MPLISTLDPSNNLLTKLLKILKNKSPFLLEKYTNSLNSLNIRLNSKPVIFFLSSISLTSLILLIYNLQKLIHNIKTKYKKNQSKLKVSSVNSKNRQIFVPYKNDFIKLIIKPPNYDKYEQDKLIFKSFLKDELKNKNINLNFIKKIYIIWKLILIPKFFSKNTYYLVLQISCLILRTYLSLLITKLDAQIVKDLIDLKGKSFLRDLIYWFLFAFPASYTNAGIKYLGKRLSLNFRTNLIRYCHDLYMDPSLVYYKLQFNTNLNNGNDDSLMMLKNYKLDYKYIDQYMTDDLLKFTDVLTSLFSNIGKPFMDLIFFAIYLRDNLGTSGIISIFTNFFLSGYLLKIKSPNFNKLSKQKSSLEGIFYNYNLNLINNCEEISFYKGINLEKRKIKNIFNNLINHYNSEINQRFNYDFLQDYVMKYTWSALGYLISSIPIVFAKEPPRIKNTSDSLNENTKNMRNFIVNKRLMLSLADAGSRLMYSIKDISKLSGCTDRLFTLLLNLHQVHDQNFQYGLVNSNSLSNQIGFASSLKLNSFTSRRNLLANSSSMAMINTNNGINGTIEKHYNGIRFERINIIIPSPKGNSKDHTLIQNLNFQLERNKTLLILGKNGIGKTSIIRVLSELWPLYSGLISKPSDSEIFYVSQKPYFLANANLRDQIIYPLTHLEMLQKGYSDEDLIRFLQIVGLDYLFERVGNNLNYNPAVEDDDDEEEEEYNEQDKSKTNSSNSLTISPTNENEDLLMVRDESKTMRSLSLSSVDSNIPLLMNSSKRHRKKKSTGNGWFNILSGGERQKLIMARILFHNKPFIVLDEPTNAVSYDSEDLLFEMLKSKDKGWNFTIITLSHRPLLQKYHDYLLDLKDNGKWEFKKLSTGNHLNTNRASRSNNDPMDSRNNQYVDEEIQILLKDLDKADKAAMRRQELKDLLDN